MWWEFSEMCHHTLRVKNVWWGEVIENMKYFGKLVEDGIEK